MSGQPVVRPGWLVDTAVVIHDGPVNAPSHQSEPTAEASAPRERFVVFGVLDLVTGLAVIGLMRLLLSANPLWPIALGVWATLLLISAMGLFAGTGWGLTAARVAAVYQLAFLVVLIIGILSSAAYLWGVYGQIGVGVAVALLLVLALLLEVAGLLPVFKLRRLGLTARSLTARSSHGWPLTAAVLLVAVLFYCVAVHARARLDPVGTISPAERAAMSRYLISAIEPDSEAVLPADIGGPDVPWVIRVYRRGRLESRVEVVGNLHTAAEAGAAALAENRPAGMGRLALVVDRVIAETPIEGRDGIVGALSVVPGLDGVTGEIDGQRFTVTPHELVSRRMLSEYTPIPFIPEFEIGVDLSNARALLCTMASAAAGCEVHDLRRARTESWVHQHGETLALYRGRPLMSRPITADDAMAGAIAAGEYVRRSLKRDGRFQYKYSPQTGRGEMEPYNIPRHAGTSWFLLEMFGSTGKEMYLSSAEKALDWLEARIGGCGDGLRCVRERDRAYLGSQALPLIAFATHARLTNSDRYVDAVQRLAEVVQRLQQENGDFHFALDPRTGQPIPGNRQLYAGGQGALGLALSGQVLHDDAQLDAARTALDFIAGPFWDFFLSDLFFIEEHWACLAADEVHRLFGDSKHARFCRAAARFDRQLQHAEGQTVFPDYVGGIGFSPFFPPYTTTAASRTEGTIAAYRISKRQGEPDPELLRGIEEAVGFLLHNQYKAGDTWAFQSRWSAIGGVPWNYYDPVIRIDTVQHTGSVLLHGAELMRDASSN
ncbi:MAG: hypothetical protein WCE62_00625 [Polyangiales bacterium]